MVKLKIKFSRFFWTVVSIEIFLSIFFFFFFYNFSEVIQARYLGMVYIAFGVILLIVFFVLLLAISESINIIRLIERINKFSARIAHGDFQAEIKSKRKDELGVLVENLNWMKTILRDNFRKLEKEKEKIGAVIKNMEDGVVVLDQQRKIILMNAAAERMTGQSGKQYQGKNYQEVLFIKRKEEDVFDLGSWMDKVAQTRKIINFPQDCFLKLLSGEEIIIEGTIFPLLGEKRNIDNLVFVFRDVTRKREVERMRSEFVFILSHQLREPVSSIRWNTELLLREETGPLTKIQKTLLGNIYQSTAKTINLFNNLLNVSDIANGALSLDLTPGPIEEIVQRVVDGLQPLAESRGIKLITRFEKNLPPVNIDRLKISQAIQNIVENALSYGKIKGQVFVSLKKTDERVVFSCQDDGIGIAVKNQSKIFHKFFRADNAQKSQPGGAGLGLHIAKVFVEKMPGGKIWFQSAGLDKGSTFYISFPVCLPKK